MIYIKMLVNGINIRLLYNERMFILAINNIYFSKWYKLTTK